MSQGRRLISPKQLGQNVTLKEAADIPNDTNVHSMRGHQSIPFFALARFPTLKITAQNEEFAANLYYWNAVFFNNSAEMPNRKAGQFGGGWNIEEHLRSRLR